MADLDNLPVNLFASVFLYGSDPVSVRYALMPGRFTSEETATAAAVLFGLDPAGLTFAVSADGGLPEEGKLPVRSFLRPGDRLTVTVRRPEDPKNGSELRLNLEILETPEKLASLARKELTVPETTAAFGINIPEPIWKISEINRIGDALSDCESIKYADRFFFRAGDLVFSGVKCENALRKVFAPETARKEVDRGLTLPMAQTLETLKVPELRTLLSRLGIYGDSTMRKPDLIRSILRRFDRNMLQNMMNEMPIREYKNLRDFLFGDLQAPAGMDPEKLFPMMTVYGMTARAAKGQIRVAAEMADELERMYEDGAEEKFLETKKWETALRACAALYTLFDRGMYLRMVAVIDPAADLKTAAAWIDRNGAGSHGFCRLSCKNGAIWFRPDYMTDRSQVQRLWAMNEHTVSTVWLPDRDEALALASEDSCFPDKPPFSDLFHALVNSSAYFTSDSIMEDYYGIIRTITVSGTESEILEAATKHMGYYTRQRPQEELKEALREVTARVPRAALGGYTDSNCPKEILDHALEVRNRLEQKEILKGYGVSSVQRKGGKRR